MSLDERPLMNERGRVLSLRQGDFIQRFNSLNRLMASAPDLYATGKSNDSVLIQSLQNDFQQSWFISSTRINYTQGSLEGTIAHYFGSNVITPTEQPVFIPVYNHASLESVLNNAQGLAFLQALFGTNDSAAEIKRVLVKLSGKNVNQLFVWTPSQESRQQNPGRAAGFSYFNDEFHIICYNYISYCGRSRGVLDSPEGARGKKDTQDRPGAACGLPFELTEGIDRKSGCVYFSNVQHLGSLVQYAGVFYYQGRRYAAYLSVPEVKGFDKQMLDRQISKRLSGSALTKDALGGLVSQFSPFYCRLLKYMQQDGAEKQGFVLVDDFEAFGSPRTSEVKK